KPFSGKRSVARGENGAQIIGESFVDPEKLSTHWLVEVSRGEARRPAVLSVPGMHHLVLEKPDEEALTLVLVDERPFGDAVVAGFMVLEPEMRRVVRESQKEVVVPVMPRAKERQGLGHEVLVGALFGSRDRERGFAVGRDVETMSDAAVVV